MMVIMITQEHELSETIPDSHVQMQLHETLELIACFLTPLPIFENCDLMDNTSTLLLKHDNHEVEVDLIHEHTKTFDLIVHLDISLILSYSHVFQHVIQIKFRLMMNSSGTNLFAET